VSNSLEVAELCRYGFPGTSLDEFFVLLFTRQQGTKRRRSSEIYIEAIAPNFL
jgi:hypothetical protein